MRAHIVIGANYGDEGKGLVTDYLAVKHGLVVRFNGGAQASHTVCVKPHVHKFQHVGSGTFKGAETFLSRHFLVNPRLFLRELNVLRRWQPLVIVSPGARVTTPFDVLLNHLVETKQRHGSCGCGINETVERSTHSPWNLYVDDMSRWAWFEARVLAIAHEWLPARAAALGVEVPPSLYIEPLVRGFMDEAKSFLRQVTVMEDVDVLKRYDDVVFEGAQGLLLDEKKGTFPHVTRSSTGCANAIDLLVDADRINHHVDLVYVTRTYLTRHGNGPLDGERQRRDGECDSTNVDNVWQGQLRYADLDLVALRYRIVDDVPSNLCFRQWIAVTHVDQADDTRCAPRIADALRMPLRCWSDGPDRENIHGGEDAA